MPNNVRLSPPPRNSSDIQSREWLDWFNSVRNRLGEGPFKLQSYSVSSLPSAAQYGSIVTGKEFSSMIFVYDETGGPTLAFSDGTDWRRVQDRSIVS